jgi:hypothetical protein
MVASTPAPPADPSPAPPPAPVPAPAQPASAPADNSIIVIPDVSGKHRAEAEAALRAAGVRGEIHMDDASANSNFAIATVCVQTPGGGHQSRATLSVMLTYCQPPPPKPDRNPTLVGLSVQDAERLARSRGFTGEFHVKVLPQLDVKCQPSMVCNLSPDVGWQNAHSLDLYINRDDKVELP